MTTPRPASPAITTDAQLPPLTEPDTVYEMWGQNMDAWGKHKIQAYARTAIAAHCAQREGEAVAWLWEYIGKDPMRDQYKPCARALHEMDPKAPPYPDSWKPVAPLYTHPSAPPTEEAEQAAAYRWLEANAFQKTAYDLFGNGGHWTVGVHSDDSRKSFMEAIRSAMSAARTGGKE